MLEVFLKKERRGVNLIFRLARVSRVGQGSVRAGGRLNLLLDEPDVAGGIEDCALTVAVIVVFDGFGFAGAGGEGLFDGGGGVGHKQTDGG